MSKKHYLIRVAAAAGLMSAIALPAFAADAIEEAPQAPAPIEEAPVSSGWGGAYLGGQLGYTFGHSKVHRTDNKVDRKGVNGGAFAGYNADLGNGVIAGVEGDVGYNGAKGSNAGTRAKSGAEGSIRARLGYAITPDILPYVTAGGAAGSTKISGGGVSDRKTALGWTAGAGADVKVTDQVFLRGEYRYTDLGSKDFNTAAGRSKVSLSDNRVQFGVGMKF